MNHDAQSEMKTQEAAASGILVIDKPAGLTSHDVVGRVRRLLKTRRVGHTGTLDPFATGVLVVLVNHATRLAQFLANAEKEYRATIRFGYATDTGDLTGTPLTASAAGAHAVTNLIRLDEAAFNHALAPLRGEIEQVPPMYSAKKIQGQKLYELARQGVEVERKAVRINVAAFEIMPNDAGAWLRRNDDDTCDLQARVVCSAGTYVRSLAESLGERLGTPAHLAALRRTRAGNFSLPDAVTLDELAALAAQGETSSVLIPPAAALAAMPAVHLTDEELAHVRHGRAFNFVPRSTASQTYPTADDDGAHVRLLSPDGALAAIGVFDSMTNSVRPRVLLIPAASMSD